mgnify:CR=1 FL=1
MKELYHVEGILNEGFVGQITYMISLEEVYRKLDIEFTFDKRVYEEADVTSELMAKTREILEREYNLHGSDEELKQAILNNMKAEIHTLATLNDQFIGCIHKQLLTRHMHYDYPEASEGCVPQETFDGVLKVTVLVFNVIKDNTRYALTVRAE